jgi:hypothetical protein
MKNSTATSLLETVKVVLSVVAMCCLLNSVNAQSTLPVNAATHKVSYRFSVPVTAGISKEKAFETVQGWVAQNSRVFTRTNDLFAMNAASNDGNKTFTELEQVFNNTQPLQSIDPEGNRLAARVMVKYQSANSNRCLQMMYVQYYLVVTIKDNAIEAEVTDMRYNHFNKKSFQLMRINSWTDYTSCEPISTIEDLIANEHCHEEFCAFATFLNNDVAKLQNQLSAFVQGSQTLTLNK